MTDRKKPRGEMLMDIGAQAVKVERRKWRAEDRQKLREMCRRYLETQELEP